MEIIIPFDCEAQQRMLDRIADDLDVIKIFFSHEDVQELIASPIYNFIKKEGVCFDKQEGGFIIGLNDNERLRELHQLIKDYEPTVCNPIVSSLKSLVEVAIRFGTGIYFSSEKKTPKKTWIERLFF